MSFSLKNKEKMPLNLHPDYSLAKPVKYKTNDFGETCLSADRFDVFVLLWRITHFWDWNGLKN
jgi:hypothetical protein